jgi:4-phospho-D-threonate 3-dehydrogenase / 4-phospho-D-erythronate 3-dehydrogenase
MLPRIALTAGDPAGIGPEITLAAIRDEALRSICEPVVVGSPEALDRCARKLDRAAPAGVRVVHAGAGESFAPGEVSEGAGRAAHAAVIRACELAATGEVDAIATGPIHKGALREAGVPHIGHTEILGDFFGVPDPVTVFVTGKMRIFFFSRHLSLRDAIARIDERSVADFVRRVDGELKKLGLEQPRIGLAALNPHAGDSGQFGDEEILHLEPAARRCRAEGVEVTDPLAADTIFHLALEGRFDGVVSLYHDQGHIAAKTRDFHGTVSATLGLPVLRTSVDHGTAHGIAWQGKADARGMKEAVRVAAELCRGLNS